MQACSAAPAPAAASSSTRALEGVVVLDFSHVIAGPFATYYLAALGARVIKIENPDGGDSMRRKPAVYASLNHGKEGHLLDLNRDEDRDRVWALFNEANVVVDNMRPGVLERHGFSESVLRARKPGLIYCSISGYGRQGAWAQRPAYDHVIQAASGMTLMAGANDDGPIKVGFPVVDSATGMLAALALIAAVRRRDLTGQGESIDVSMLGSALQLMYTTTVEVMQSGVPPTRVGNVGYSGSPGAEILRCRDGLIAVGANTPQQVLALAEVLGIRGRIEPLLDGQTRGFVSSGNAQEVRGLLGDAISMHRACELEERLNAAAVPAARVRDLAECIQACEQADLLGSWDLRGEATVKVPGLGFRAKTLFAGGSEPFGEPV